MAQGRETAFIPARGKIIETMQLPEQYSNKIAIVVHRQEISYAELRGRIDTRVETLGRLSDGIVVLRASRNPEFVVNILALLCIGRAAAILPAALTSYEQDARIALLGRCFEIDDHGEITRNWTLPSAALHRDTRIILFTSGSAGFPKAVQLSDRNIRSNLHAVAEALDFHKAQEQTLFLPLHYSYGFLGQFLPALELGIRTVLVEKLIELKDAFNLRTLKGMVSGVPSHYETILRMLPSDFVYDKLSHIVTAGAYMPPELRARLHKAFPSAAIYNNYGQTEASPRILCLKSSHPLFYTKATGYPVRGIEVKLSGDGELMVKGPQIMCGYLGDEQATSEKVREGWLATGDKAEIADDGLVTVLGRDDELFNMGGERTSRFEVENALKCTSLVRNAGVFAIEDPLYGEKIVALIEPMEESVTVEAVLAELPRFISLAKIPRDLCLVDKLPANASGKLDKNVLKRIYRELRQL